MASSRRSQPSSCGCCSCTTRTCRSGRAAAGHAAAAHPAGGGDFEQDQPRPFYHACGWACLYTLAALDTPSAVSDGLNPRHSLQMLHEHDSCCFATAGLHANVTAYNRFVQGELAKQAHGAGFFATAANLGNFHEIVRDF